MPDLKQWVIYFFGKHLLKYVMVTPSRHPKEMRVFSIFDLHIILAIGPSFWAGYLRTLGAFLKRLKLLDTWSSISDIYPRGLIHLYYFLLFTWAKFNNITEKIIASPMGGIPAELFIRYICEMDIQIDRVDGAQKLNLSPFFPKRSAKSQELIKEFLGILEELKLTRDAKQSIIRAFQVYRQSYLTLTQFNARQPVDVSSVEATLIDKSKVAGRLWSTWAVILSLSYFLSETQVERSESLLYNFGMVTQVFDDMADVPHDIAECQPNIIYAICHRYPNELDALGTHLSGRTGRFLNLEWAKDNLPLTMSAAKELASQFLDEAIALDSENRIKADMEKCYGALTKI